MVTEVHHTHGGRHAHVLRPDEQDRATTTKELNVSPFFPATVAHMLRLPVAPRTQGEPR